MSRLGKHGNPKNKGNNPPKRSTGKNPVDFNIKPKEDTPEEVTDTGTDNSTDTGTTKSTEELAAALKAKLGVPDKKPDKHQISAWIDPNVYKEFKKYRGNGDRGQKSELVNNLLKIYFGIED